MTTFSKFPGRMALCAGLVGLALLVGPAPASARMTGQYHVGDGGLRTLNVFSDAEADTIALGCSAGSVTLNGAPATLKSSPITGSNVIPCGGSSGPEVIFVSAGGGNDTINLTGVSREAGFTAIHRNPEKSAPTDDVVAQGGPGADTIIGGPLGEELNLAQDVGGDTVYGNGGDDKIFGTSGADKLFGGAGRDVIQPDTGADEVHGGPGADFIESVYFDKRRDRLFGDGGKDTINGDAAGDLMDGGAGNDTMDGMAGKDRMYGKAGKDVIYGRGGADNLSGGPGADTIYGNAGNDTIRGGPGKDKLFGGAGRNNVKQ